MTQLKQCFKRNYNFLTVYLKKAENEEQSKHKVSKIKGIVKSRMK